MRWNRLTTGAAWVGALVASCSTPATDPVDLPVASIARSAAAPSGTLILMPLGSTTIIAPAALTSSEGDLMNPLGAFMPANLVARHHQGFGGNTQFPAKHAPSVPATPMTSVNPGQSGFDGISHREHRLAGTGIYAASGFNLEPPDQALCVGNGFVVEAVNSAIAVYTTSGAPLAGPEPLQQFYGVPPQINSVTNVFGESVFDPHCHYDGDTDRWYVLAIGYPNGGRSRLLLGVSDSGDPTGTWSIRAIDAVNDGQNGTPELAGCPCDPDYPWMGADQHGLYITTNEFDAAGAFAGVEVYALSKTALAAGLLPPVAQISRPQMPEGAGGFGTGAFAVRPAVTAPGAAHVSDRNGTEYMVGVVLYDEVDDRLAVWSITNTRSLETASPALSLEYKIVHTELIGQAPWVEQMDGPTPLRDIWCALFGLHPVPLKLEVLAPNGKNGSTPIFAAGKLWTAHGAIVKPPTGNIQAGVAWSVLSVDATGNPSVAAQGYVGTTDVGLIFPSIGVNDQGEGAIVFSLSGPDHFPSAAYVTLDEHGTGPIHVAAAGAAPLDGYVGYPNPFFPTEQGFDGDRWGDYSAAAVSADGAIWLGVAYITPKRRSMYANWGTYISRIAPDVL